MELFHWLKQAMVVSFRVLWNLVVLIVFGLLVSDVTTAYIGANFVPFCLALFIIPLANTMFNEVWDLINQQSAATQERIAARDRAMNLTAARAYNPLRPQILPRPLPRPINAPVDSESFVNQEVPEAENSSENNVPSNEEERQIAMGMLFRFMMLEMAMRQRRMAAQNNEGQEGLHENEDNSPARLVH